MDASNGLYRSHYDSSYHSFSKYIHIVWVNWSHGLVISDEANSTAAAHTNGRNVSDRRNNKFKRVDTPQRFQSAEGARIEKGDIDAGRIESAD
jgi:hypothetical protein